MVYDSKNSLKHKIPRKILSSTRDKAFISFIYEKDLQINMKMGIFKMDNI